jgi:uncharacterized RDD family membrane protein YckC
MPPPPGGPGAYQTYQPAGGPTSYLGADAEPNMRVVARLIDWGVVFVVSLVIYIPLGVSAGGFSRGSGVGYGALILAGVLVAALSMAYEVVMTAQRGQTLGKMAVGIKIVRLDGQPLDFASAAKRYAPRIGLAVLGFIPIVGLIASLGVLILAIVNTVFVFQSHESVYDKVGQTRVVSAK